MTILEQMPWAAEYAALKELAKAAEIAGFTSEERARYERSLKTFNDNVAIAYRQREEGLEEGLEKGRAEGRAEERTLVAQKMKQKGMSTEVISELTGLSAEEIEKL